MSQEQSLTDKKREEWIFQPGEGWRLIKFSSANSCVGFYFCKVADSVEGITWIALCLTNVSKFGNPRNCLGIAVWKGHFRYLDYQENRDKSSVLHVFQCYYEKGQLAISGNTKVLLEVKISRSWHLRLHWKS